MPHRLLAYLTLLFVGLSAAGLVRAQSSTHIIVVLDEGTALEQEGEQQLRRLLSSYPLNPWIFTRTVKIDSYVIPHSHPVLTLNTRNVRDDHAQLSTFIHEQAHWFEAADERAASSQKAIATLRSMYPNPPSSDSIGTRSEHSTYLHLIINWLELDAMRHLIGDEAARTLLAEKTYYKWIYERVLEDTEAIGAVLREHGLIIHPD